MSQKEKLEWLAKQYAARPLIEERRRKVTKPKKVIRPVQKNIALPEDLVAKVEIELFSVVEQRVPMGAWQALMVVLLQKWLQERGIVV